MLDRIKYYLGFTVVVKTHIGWVITKREGFIRTYLEKDGPVWWCSLDTVQIYSTFKSKLDAQVALLKYKQKKKNPLSPLWHDM